MLLAGCSADEYHHQAELDALDHGGKADGPSAPHKPWTFVLYGAADNNLADDIRRDVNELESVGSTDDINFLAFLDRPEGAQVYYLLRDPDPDVLPSPSLSWGRVDSGDARTLVDVFNWAADRFPADHMALVIGGHGGGTPRTIAPDDSTGHSISAHALEGAIASITRTSGPLELFGADACLMQSVELAYQLRDQTSFVVGSENTEPGTGWDYAFVGRHLAADVEADRASGASLAEVMVGGYARSYQGSVEDVTLSALDTRALDATRVEQLEHVASALLAHAQTAGGKTELQQIARSAQRTDASGSDDYADALSLSLQLQTTTSPQLKAAARQLELLLLTPDSLYTGAPSLVHVAWGRGGTGASIYFPLGSEHVDAYVIDNRFAAETQWASAVRAIW